MNSERRNQYRNVFEEQLLGELHLHAEGRPVAVLHVEDVSPYGIGLLTDGFVSNGSSISLRYQHETTDIEVLGTVVWRVPMDSEGLARLGINLQEDDMVPNVALFNAVTSCFGNVLS